MPSLSPALSTVAENTADHAAIQQSLETVRETLGIEVAYLSEFIDSRAVFRAVSAPGLEAMIQPSQSMDLREVYCKHIIDGNLPRLLPDTSARDHLVSLPLLRLRRASTGAFELDGRFMPPSLHIHASPMLTLHLRRLMDALQAKVDALYGMHREPSKHVIEFRSGDIASFWLLHTASTALAGLTHLARNPGFHPERLFERLLELAGSLMTFSRSFTLADLPTYDHTQPGQAFVKLDQLIRELLETVISTRSFAIALNEVIPSFHRGRLDSEQITPGTQFYLGVSASMPPAELVDIVPQRFKVGAPDDVDKLVLSAMPGVRLTHVPQVPAAVPVRPGNYYFSLEPRGALYERMLQAQSLTLYTPSGIQDLSLELVAINA